jgi:hypothetical protein
MLEEFLVVHIAVSLRFGTRPLFIFAKYAFYRLIHVLTLHTCL